MEVIFKSSTVGFGWKSKTNITQSYGQPKKIQINQAKQVGSTVSHPLSYFYFFTYSLVIECLSVKNKNKASAKILNSSTMVFICFLFGLRPW